MRKPETLAYCRMYTRLDDILELFMQTMDAGTLVAEIHELRDEVGDTMRDLCARDDGASDE